ncbi:hypothetical protein SNEBB_004359 [Seison nebaliae]|nr:hypothetical protein SNEBB_004359 [Seison nebaliae]
MKDKFKDYLAIFLVVCVFYGTYLFFPKIKISFSVVNETDKGQSIIQSIGNTSSNLNRNNSHYGNTTKIILLWVPFFSVKDYGFGLGGPELFRKKGCPETNCMVTNDRRYSKDADAFVMHLRNYRATDKPKIRKKNSLNIFFLYESPPNTPRLMFYNNFFHLTMSYRLESMNNKIRELIYDANYSNFNPTTDFTEDKEYDILWFVSNCHTNSKREKIYDYFQQNGLTVNRISKACQPRNDEYSKKCKYQYQGADSKECAKFFSKHRFYFAAENALCEGYVTEKMFLRLQYPLVPIVYNGVKDEEYYKNMNIPLDAMVNVRNFSSIAELTQHIIKIKNDKKLFNSLVEKRRHYKIKYNGYKFCDLCTRLHSSLPVPPPIQNMESFWRTDKCINPTNLFTDIKL